MGLADVVKKAAQTAIKATGNIAVSLVYRDVDPTYDPATGTASDAGTNYSVDGIKTDFEESEFARPAQAADDLGPRRGDFKILISSLDLVITPKLADTITLNSIEHSVLNIATDPAEAAWIIHVRARR